MGSYFGIAAALAIIINVTVAGWLASKIMKKSHGIMMTLLVGVVGTVIGGFLANLVGLGGSGFIMLVVYSTISAVIFLWVVGKLRH